MLKSPVAVFLLVAIAAVGVIFLATNRLADSAASDEAISEASGSTEILARSVIEPDVPPNLAKLSAENLAKYSGVLDKFDRQVKRRLLDLETVRQINIWNNQGVLVYSSQPSLIGRQFGLDEDQLRILEDGGVAAEPADPDRPENQIPVGGERDQSAGNTVEVPQVQIYTSMTSPGGEPLLLEAYYDLDDIDERSTEIYDSFRWITIAPLLLLILLATLLLAGLARQLRRAGAERERLLRSAMDASDAERRRIARDLHDSVVQDLAGSAFAVSAIARNPETPDDSRVTLEDAGTSLRTSLKSLRSLLAEIHPPDLHAAGLAAALSDLIAPASNAGIQASVSVEGAETVADDRAALVWRVAQEAVRNAIRHSEASTLAVTVNSDGRRLTLEVVDDGVGFDPSVRDPHSYGLRGLRSLVVESGGTLEVRSAPGEGTTVSMEVDAQ